ncbi:right-handed parallel beta-helix repeat-containing protein [Pedobacter nanyangensis]|uniref:right-handed parallel beta-helix repeat-containing protein n=1 Tax=Pedobacter nanyangensis TaxID=1562389 RepID=UPI000DE44DE9|nr:right-handed parallel beta-helix repeat-containing protein [Pedobacter nanyangensis]
MKKLYLKTLGAWCLSLFAFNVNAQTTYYVKTDGSGAAVTATSWSAASNDLQGVINTAQSGDKIFVAKGTYLPNSLVNTADPITTKDYAFVLKNGVSIYGGFAGTETSELQRIAGNETILSGDLNGNDVDETSGNTNTYMTANKTDNVYHVVLAVGLTNATIFDGFTVTKGDASANAASTVAVSSKNIDRRLGGGIYILESSNNFIISNVKVTINRANGDGDSSGGCGSGIYINNSSPTIENCEITKSFNMNASPKTAGNNYGSGMSLVVSSHATITNTIFSENFGGYGGAVAINGSNPTFTNCTFKGNRGGGRGGAVDVRGASPTFTSCLFSENTATGSGGGAVYNYTGRASFFNCIFYKNSAATTNGAAYGSQSNNYGAIFVNNTFYENRNTYGGAATNLSAGIYVATVGTSASYPDKKTYVYNNIFFGNTSSVNINTTDIYAADAALLAAVSNNIVQQTPYIAANQGNLINVNPQFISAVPGHIAFLAPQLLSPAKDAGNDSYNTTTVDFNGRGRKNGTIDIGAVEYHDVLPVSFISFTAKATAGGAQLRWKVASETDSKQYLISRSSNGKEYDLIAEIKSAGNSSIPLSYGYTDQTFIDGAYYYKLEQEDLDGTISYLATQVVKNHLTNNAVSVYPNPTKANATIALTDGIYHKYSVVGLQGTTVLSGNIGIADRQLELNLSRLSSGTYIIMLTGFNVNKSVKVIKL